MSRDNKVLLVGWDAADWKMIHPLMDRGLMPNVKGLVDGGVIARLATLSPVLSPMLWTSIATGKRPFKHGVLGFTEPTADGTAVQPVTNLSRKTKAIWNVLSQNGKRCHVVGWWPSHPAEPINGVMVSNHYQRAPRSTDPNWPMAPGTVHPPELAETLAALRVHPLELTPEHVLPFVPLGHKIDQSKDRRLDMLLRTIADCTSIHSCATHLLEHEPWDFAAVYYDAIDHFGHGFMKYHPPRRDFIPERDFEIYQNVVAAGYVYHDMMLGRLLELAGDDTTVILMSDHGFHPDHLRPHAIPIEPAGPAVEHRDFGILAIRGPRIRRDELVHSASLLDIAPTILTLFGLPVGDDMDGRALLDAFVEPPLVERIPSWDAVEGEDGQHPKDRKLDASESKEVMEQLVALGYVERPSGDQDKAIKQTVCELDYNLAMSYMDAGMHGSAAPILATLYRDYPLEFRFGIQLAMCLHTLGMTDDMSRLVGDLNRRWRKAAERARRRLVGIAEVARQRRLERKKGEDTTAPVPRDLFTQGERAVVRKLRAIARGNAQTLDYLASSVATSERRFGAALDLAQKASKSQTRTPGFYLRVGNAYLALKQHDQAEECYTRVLDLDPDNPNAYVGLCRSYLQRRRPGAALQAATKAIGLKYHFPPAHYFLGVARERAGDIDGAIEALERALSQNPNFAEAHARLAGIYERHRPDAGKAVEQRKLARDIRQERQRMRRTRILHELQALDDALIDESLPELPEVKEPAARRSLALPPATPNRKPAATEGTSFVTIVSGLPRSGTSMMMQMLAAGGLPVMCDDVRPADENNPRGYFELEKVKALAADNSWVDEARGKVIKVVAPLVPHLPQECPYRIVFMRRDFDEVVASQSNMLRRLEREGGKLTESRLKEALQRQVQRVRGLLAAHDVPVLIVDYAAALDRPAEVASRVAAFLGVELDQQAMQRAVDPALHRERTARR
jgi:predicted AlkP superfamily phosphohydrolase/phosphomutase/tetratricopeptide (TPR) repeat protein